MDEVNILRELENYGWQLDRHYPFEYSSKFSCIWIHFKHDAFPDLHIAIEVHFYDGLKTKAQLEVSDDNCDNAGDSMDILTQEEFDAEALWDRCELLMLEREERGIIRLR